MSIRGIAAGPHGGAQAGVVLQFGPQQRSDLKFRWACELARNGAWASSKRPASGSIHLCDGLGDLGKDVFGDKKTYQRVSLGRCNTSKGWYLGRVTNGVGGQAGRPRVRGGLQAAHGPRKALGRYRPHIDDGVLLNKASLWELVPSWQAEPKKAWQALARGDYDWAQTAMDYWPDRVREKCKTNKSYAIAHGLV